MNDLEMQLRSWAPRRPSAKLKERIFVRNRTTPATGEGRAACSVLRAPFAALHVPLLRVIHWASTLTHWLRPTSFRWLAPATAALFLTCILLNQRNAPMASPATAPLIAMILSSNQSAAAYLPGSFQREQNRLPSDTFEWTNGSGSTSSISSLSESKGRN
jgi:hypothetical protein